MRIFENLEDCCKIINPVVTIGTFDGVHLGHQQVFLQLGIHARKYEGESVVITFWPHPRHVLNHQDEKLKLLNTFEEKIKLFEKFGVQNVVIIPFTSDFSKQSPDVFIKELLIKKIHAKAVIIGYDHRFGNNRTGSYSYLFDNAQKFNFKVFEVPAFDVKNVSISSTKIRKLLLQGQVEDAKYFLGYNYHLTGKVTKGLGLGNRLGFPTANIEVVNENKLIPGNGIYVVAVEIENKEYYGMLNIGINPTIKNKGFSIEVNVFDFSQKIYDKEVKISFLKRLRDEEKYDSIDELKQQLKIDKEESLKYIQVLNEQ